MSKTPITDAACMVSGTQLEIVHASVARKLEEQRNELIRVGNKLADFVYDRGDFRVQSDSGYTRERNAFHEWQDLLVAAKEGAK